MVMNKSEEMVYNWLIKTKKYKSNEIRYQSNRSPDFVCEDGKSYEAKRLNGNAIIFSSTQIDAVEKNKSIIVVTDNIKRQIIKEFSYSDIKNVTFPKVYVKDLKNLVTIQLTVDTREKLKDVGTKRETYDDIINRLLEVKK